MKLKLVFVLLIILATPIYGQDDVSPTPSPSNVVKKSNIDFISDLVGKDKKDLISLGNDKANVYWFGVGRGKNLNLSGSDAYKYEAFLRGDYKPSNESEKTILLQHLGNDDHALQYRLSIRLKMTGQQRAALTRKLAKVSLLEQREVLNLARKTGAHNLDDLIEKAKKNVAAGEDTDLKNYKIIQAKWEKKEQEMLDCKIKPGAETATCKGVTYKRISESEQAKDLLRKEFSEDAAKDLVNVNDSPGEDKESSSASEPETSTSGAAQN